MQSRMSRISGAEPVSSYGGSSGSWVWLLGLLEVLNGGSEERLPDLAPKTIWRCQPQNLFLTVCSDFWKSSEAGTLSWQQLLDGSVCCCKNLGKVQDLPHPPTHPPLPRGSSVSIIEIGLSRSFCDFDCLSFKS